MLPFYVSSKVLGVVLGVCILSSILFVKYDFRCSGLTEQQALCSRPFLLRQLTPCSCGISCLVLSGKLLMFSVIPLHVIALPEEFCFTVPTGTVALLGSA